MKSIFKVFYLFIIINLFFLIKAYGLNSTSANEQNILTAYVKFGVAGKVKLNRYTPVMFTLVNNTDNDVNGVFTFNINKLQTYDSYKKNISIPKKGASSFTSLIKLSSDARNIEYFLEGENKKKSIELNYNDIYTNTQSFLVGVLTDNFDNISYINNYFQEINSNNSINYKLKINSNTNIRGKISKIELSDLPEEKNYLSVFDAIIINDFNTSKINENQYIALKAWVEDGGALIIGGGKNNVNTLKLFSDNYIRGNIINSYTKDIDISYSNFFNKNSFKNSIISQLDISKMDIEDSEELIKISDDVLAHKVLKGKGAVIIAAFDFASIKDRNDATLFINGFMEKACAEPASKYFQNSPDMQNIYHISSFPEISLPKVRNISILYYIYAIILIPVCYLVLKKLDKRQLMWVVIPALACIITIYIFVYSLGNRISDYNITLVNIFRKSDNSYISNLGFGSILNAKKGSYTISTSDDVNIVDIIDEDYYNYSMYSAQNATQEKKLALNLVNYIDSKSITVNNATSFSAKNFNYSNNINIGGNISVEAFSNMGKINGTVTNNTDIDLEDVVLLYDNYAYRIIDLKKGETKDIGGAVVITDQYNGFNNLYGINQQNLGMHKNEEESQEESKMLQKIEIMIQGLNTGMLSKSLDLNTITVLAWNRDILTKDYKINGKNPFLIEKNLIIDTAKFKFQGDNIVIPESYVKISVSGINGNISMDDVSLLWYGSQGSFDLEYSLGENIDINKVEIDKSININNMNKVDKDGVNFYVYSKESGNYDLLLSEDNTYLEGDELKKYILEGNIIKIRAEVTTLSESSGSLPKMAAEGKDKNAGN